MLETAVALECPYAHNNRNAEGRAVRAPMFVANPAPAGARR